MKEKDFQKQIKKSFVEYGAWCFNIPDMPRANSTEMFRFIPEKPGDLIAVYRSCPMLIECKMMKGVKSFNRSVFQSAKDKRLGLPFEEWHQVKELDDFEDTGKGQSFVFLNIRNATKEKRLNVLLFFDWKWLKRRLEEKRGIPKEEIKAMISMNYLPGYKSMYDLSNFLECASNKGAEICLNSVDVAKQDT